MPLRDRFMDDLKTAMKAGEKEKVSAIRLITSELKNKDVEARGAGRETASDEEVLGVLQKMVKQRQESLAIFEKNAREDLAAVERSELAIISGYLPQQLDETATKAAIDAAIAETGAAGMKDMGKVIASLRASHAGQMDFGKASALVKAALSA